jgi:hypothetical protein
VLLFSFVKETSSISRFGSKPRMASFLVSAAQKKNATLPARGQHARREVPRVVRIDPNDFTINLASNSALNNKDNIISWHWTTKKVDFIGRGKDLFHKINDDSHDAKKRQVSPPPDGCIPQHDWQEQSFPTCNALHEQNMVEQSRSLAKENHKFLLGVGTFRAVWLVEHHLPSLSSSSELGGAGRVEQIVLKTLGYDHDMTERREERHRVDALIAERLTASPYVLNIYGYCANSALFEFASGGTLRSLEKDGILGQWDSAQKIHVAYQAAAAIADLHDIDHDGIPSALHGDIDTSQIVSVSANADNNSNKKKAFKLNDFNGARLLYIRDPKHSSSSNKHKRICPVKPSLYGGSHRSPEDYNSEKITEKSDVYSLGNLIYTILVGKGPYAAKKHYSDAQKLIRKGHRDAIPSVYTTQSKDPLVAALVKAINMCWEQSARKRSPAREVARTLRAAMYNSDYEEPA